MCVFMISMQGRAEHHRIVVACRWITSEPLPTCAEPMADSRRAHGRRDNVRATNFFSRVDDLDNQVYRKERTGRGTSFRQAVSEHACGYAQCMLCLDHISTADVSATLREERTSCNRLSWLMIAPRCRKRLIGGSATMTRIRTHAA